MKPINTNNLPHFCSPSPIWRGRGRGGGLVAIRIIGTISILVSFLLLGFYLRDFLREKPVAAKLVTIQSRNLEFQVATTAKTVGEVLGEAGFPSDTNTRIHPNDTNLHGITIELLKPVEITLSDAGNEREIKTAAATVDDLLFEEKIGLAVTDRVTPNLPTSLAEGIKVIIDRIVDVEVTEVHEIAYEIKLEHDPESYYGREEIVVPGKLGKREQKFLITYKNGVEIKRKLLKQNILERPEPELRKFGTKVEIEETREGRASWYATKVCLSAFGGCAAHPFYGFGRYARVTARESGKSIIVRINDRGPELQKHPDRIIDLDAVAYKELAPLGSGTIEVRVELLK